MRKPARPKAAVRVRHDRRPAALIALAVAAALSAAALTSSATSAQEWQIQPVDSGIKPALGLTPAGEPVILYMLERDRGWVRVASLTDGQWQIEELAQGYFYGPPDLTVGADGIIHGAYHDHSVEDAVYIRGEGGTWELTRAADAGHDGWDNRITTSSIDGRPHMVGVDPVEFGGDGVEYYQQNEDGTWSVEGVGSGPQTYKYAISVAIDADGVPWVGYHDGRSGSLTLAHRSADGWQHEIVDAGPDTGFFSESAIDSAGGLHISYYQRTSPTSGVIKHAYRSAPGETWQVSDVDTLSAVETGFTGARNITAIDIDADDRPVIVYSDERVMKLAHLVDGSWGTEVISEADDLPFGQIVSFELDADGRPHVAYADVSSKGPLDGSIWYATRP